MAKSDSYDITIRDASNKETGFMLALDKGRKMFQVTEAPTFSPRYSTGPVDYEQFPPEQELVWSQNDWSGGFGEFLAGETSNRYFESHGLDCRFKGQITLGPLITAATVAEGAALAGIGSPMIDYKGYIYICVGTVETGVNVYQWNGTNWAGVLSAVDAYSGLGFTVYKGYLIYWSTDGTNTKYHYSTDGTNWTAVTQSNMIFRGASVRNETIWAGYYEGTNSTVHSCTNITNSANWSTATTITTGRDVIFTLFTLDGVVYIAANGGLFSLDTEGEVINLLPELQYPLTNTAFYWPPSGTAFRNEAYIHIYPGGTIWKYVEGAVTDVSPQLFGPQTTFLANTLNYLTSGDDYIYAVFRNVAEAPDCHIVLAGRQTTEGFVWHPFCKFTSYEGVAAWFSLFGVPAAPYSGSSFLFFSGGGGAAHKPSYIRLPRGHKTPDQDTNCTFDTTTRHMITPWVDYGLHDIDKAFRYFTMKCSGVTSARYIEVYYEIDESGTWTIIDKIIKPGDNSLPLPAMMIGDQDIEPIGKMIRFKIAMTTDSSASTPVIRSFAIHSILCPKPKRQFVIGIQCADNLPLLSGGMSNKTAAEVRDAIWGYRREIWPVTLTDIDGVEWEVKIMGPVQEDYIAGGQNIERTIFFTAVEAISS
jgi:hypothetical protein